jgi:hypothetical protein
VIPFIISLYEILLIPYYIIKVIYLTFIHASQSSSFEPKRFSVSRVQGDPWSNTIVAAVIRICTSLRKSMVIARMGRRRE